METRIEEHHDHIECTIIVNGGVHDKGCTFYFTEGDADELNLAREQAVAWASGVHNAFDAVSAFTMLQAAQSTKPLMSTRTKQRMARK